MISGKGCSEKFDIVVNNPRKFYRAITDLFDDEKLDYKIFEQHGKPKFERTMEDVAEFDASINGSKESEVQTSGAVGTGIGLLIAGAILLMLSFTLLSRIIWLTLGISLLLMIIGGIVMTRKKYVGFELEITMTGESYHYSGNKQTSGEKLENRERSDLVSDVRIKIAIRPHRDSYFSEDQENELKKDFEFLIKQIREIEPEYRIPA